MSFFSALHIGVKVNSFGSSTYLAHSQIPRLYQPRRSLILKKASSQQTKKHLSLTFKDFLLNPKPTSKLKHRFPAMALIWILVCLSQLEQLSQMERWSDRTTFQATWLSLDKWFPTARFISGSSVPFTLFNCVTVPVYAVSLPILSVSIKTAELSFNKWTAFGICQKPHCWMCSDKMWLSSFLQVSLSYPGTEKRSINTLGSICTAGVRVRACVSIYIHVCVSEWLSIPLQPVVFYQTSKSGRLDGESVEPLKSVINKMVRGTCMGSDPGSLL